MLFKSLVIIGSTGSGKSALAHTLFEKLTEYSIKVKIINLDAYQLYKNFNIGTAKPSEKEIIKYNYECINILEPEQIFDAQMYAKLAHKLCTKFYKQGFLPICVGGSGLYLRAFLHGLDIMPNKNDHLRNFFRETANILGWGELYNWLKAVDFQRASEIHCHDKIRIERALEIYFETGLTISDNRTKMQKLGEQLTNFDSFIINVNIDNLLLREKIFSRTNLMLDNNWIEEVKLLYKKYGDNIYNFQVMKAIGYREILEELKNNEKEIDVNKLKLNIATKTWQYAKRQKTWNNKEKKDIEYDNNILQIKKICSKIVEWFLN